MPPLLRGIFEAALSELLRRPTYRRRLNSFILRAQGWLGVGTGSTVEASGEQLVFRLVLERLKHQSQQTLCVFDVGANQGQYLHTVLDALLGVQVVVHSFEPSAATFAILHGRFRDRPGVHLNQFGLGRQSGNFDLFSDAAGSGLASLTKRRLDHLGIHHEKHERVEIKTLDGYCDAQGIMSIDLLKIDVEGHELDVLRGAEAMFGRRAIRLVTFEFGGCNIDTRTYLRDFWHFFREHGMRSFHRIMPSRHLFSIDGYDESLETFRTTNFLVVFDDAIQENLLR